MIVASQVSVRYPSRGHAVGLARVSLRVVAGEVVTVMGPPRSGRSTLVRVLAGVQVPEEGTVAFQGRSPRMHLGQRDGISLARIDEPDAWPASRGTTAIEQVAFPLLRRVGARVADRHAHEALDRVGASEVGELAPWQLGHVGRVRVGLARALVTQPRLLLADLPLAGLGPTDRDQIMRLLGALASAGGAVLFTTDGVHRGSTRLLNLERGELRGDDPPPVADIVQLHGQIRS